MSDVTKLIETAERLGPSKPLGSTPEIESYEDDSNPEVRGLAWRIADASSVEWALRRLAECGAEQEEIDRQAGEAIAAIEKRAADLKAKSERGCSYFRFQLTRYAEEHRDELLTGKKKSKEYIHGRIQFRASPERLKVVDPAALEGWLLAQPVERGLYRMEIKPEVRSLQALFKESGEIPPGCEVEVSRESINIEATAPEAAIMKKGA